MSKKPESNFIELCAQGEVVYDEIDDFVECWHKNSCNLELHEFLGMSWENYSAWVAHPELLPLIVTAHKENKELVEIVNRANQLPLAARADRTVGARKLMQWLTSIGMPE